MIQLNRKFSEVPEQVLIQTGKIIEIMSRKTKRPDDDTIIDIIEIIIEAWEIGYVNGELDAENRTYRPF